MVKKPVCKYNSNVIICSDICFLTPNCQYKKIFKMFKSINENFNKKQKPNKDKNPLLYGNGGCLTLYGKEIQFVCQVPEGKKSAMNYEPNYDVVIINLSNGYSFRISRLFIDDLFHIVHPRKLKPKIKSETKKIVKEIIKKSSKKLKKEV